MFARRTMRKASTCVLILGLTVSLWVGGPARANHDNCHMLVLWLLRTSEAHCQTRASSGGQMTASASMNGMDIQVQAADTIWSKWGGEGWGLPGHSRTSYFEVRIESSSGTVFGSGVPDNFDLDPGLGTGHLVARFESQGREYVVDVHLVGEDGYQGDPDVWEVGVGVVVTRPAQGDLKLTVDGTTTYEAAAVGDLSRILSGEASVGVWFCLPPVCF